MTVIAQVILLGRVQPFKTKGRIRYEMFSEVVLMFSVYHLICFTPFVPDVEVRFKLGYSCIGVVSFHILVSLLLILRE